MEHENNLLVEKRKINKLWGVVLYLILTTTYCIFIIKILTDSSKKDLESTGASDLYNKNRFYTLAIAKSEFMAFENIEEMNIKEKETILLHIFMYLIGTYFGLFLLFLCLYIVFKERFIDSIPQGCFVYLIVLFFINDLTIFRFFALLSILLSFTLMLFENNSHNINQMQIIFNSYLRLMCKFWLILILLLIISFSFIIIQIYMIANIHNYIPNISLLVYPVLIFYFVVSTFTCIFFLSSFITSLSFYSMLQEENCFSALFHALANAFYISGDICVYSLNYYRLEISSLFLNALSITFHNEISTGLKICSVLFYAILILVAPFIKLFLVTGWHTITYITLTGKSYAYSNSKVEQLRNRIDMYPYFQRKHEYTFYLQSIISILLFRNFLITVNIKEKLNLNLVDTVMFYVGTIFIVLFFVFFLNTMYSTITFLYLLCGDAMKITYPKLYKYFTNRREDLVIAAGVFDLEEEEHEEEEEV